MITGFLTKESPLRKVFPAGMIPLSIPGTRFCKLGAEGKSEECYFVNLTAFTEEQRKTLAELMASLGQGTVDEALQFVRQPNAEIPIRAINITGVGMPLRAFI